MYIILGYDVNVKRLSKTLNIVRQYLFPLQKSLFDGHLTEKELNALRKKLALVIDEQEDKLFIFTCQNMKYTAIYKTGYLDNNPPNII